MVGMKGDETFQFYCQSWQKYAIVSCHNQIWCTLGVAPHFCGKSQMNNWLRCGELVNFLFKMAGNDRWERVRVRVWVRVRRAHWSYSHALLAITTYKMTWGIFPSQLLIFTVNPLWHELSILCSSLLHRLQKEEILGQEFRADRKTGTIIFFSGWYDCKLTIFGFCTICLTNEAIWRCHLDNLDNV